MHKHGRFYDNTVLGSEIVFVRQHHRLFIILLPFYDMFFGNQRDFTSNNFLGQRLDIKKRRGIILQLVKLWDGFQEVLKISSIYITSTTGTGTF